MSYLHKVNGLIFTLSLTVSELISVKICDLEKLGQENLGQENLGQENVGECRGQVEHSQ